MLPNAIANRARSGDHPAKTRPDAALVEHTDDIPFSSTATGLLGTITTLPASAAETRL